MWSQRRLPHRSAKQDAVLGSYTHDPFSRVCKMAPCACVSDPTPPPSKILVDTKHRINLHPPNLRHGSKRDVHRALCVCESCEVLTPFPGSGMTCLAWYDPLLWSGHGP